MPEAGSEPAVPRPERLLSSSADQVFVERISGSLPTCPSKIALFTPFDSHAPFADGSAAHVFERRCLRDFGVLSIEVLVKRL
jgi:hypothetical protein